MSPVAFKARRAKVPSTDTTTDAAEALAAFAETLDPIVATLRAGILDATGAPSLRVHSRKFLRDNMLRAIRSLEEHVALAWSQAVPKAPASGEEPK